MELRTQSQITRLFRERRIQPNRRLGQNFLVDHNLLRMIAHEGKVGEHDVVLDIGAGTGLLTRHLAERAAAVIAVEIDPVLEALCREYTADLDNVRLIHHDILQSKSQLNPAVMDVVREALAAEPGRRLKVISNLPYIVATPVIIELLRGEPQPDVIIATVQLEVAERFTAEPGTRRYGTAAVAVQLRARARILRTLPPSVFWPQPKIDSAIIRIDPDATLFAPPRDAATFDRTVRTCFTGRRKKLINALIKGSDIRIDPEPAAAVLKAAGIEPHRRGDTLSVAEFIRLADVIAP